MRCLVLICVLMLSSSVFAAEKPQDVIQSAKSGLWSAAETWNGNRVPTAGSKVQIRTGHSVVYDLPDGPAILVLHIAGEMSFAPDRSTRLDVGLIKIQAGTDASENGFDCDA